MSFTVALLIAGGTLTFGVGILSMIGRSIEKRSMLPGFIIIALGIFMFWSGGVGSDQGYGIGGIPLAFIHVVAWIMGR